MAITHSPVRRSARKLWSPSPTTQASSGGSKSSIVCQLIVITLALPRSAVASSTTGPASSQPYTLDSAIRLIILPLRSHGPGHGVTPPRLRHRCPPA
jgi:hypothetical protein